ncbi:hypothetical protein NECAME_15390 [Necator americanus]|uniref:Cortactin-binding protein-2 N-terminal domain-containing protein n=1 Tax=Necator americanus TaxID=51031 RepID=W2SI94_NECAM|nr:hypothetical protein NECAME_15390 [Necator americanus]ETN69290.1 hypothetical protein NECAME_15390 [Necator americanus]
MNLGFNFDGEYNQATSKHLLAHQNADVVPDPDDFTREELLKLLSYFEGELQARDEVVTRLRNERIKFLLYGAKYGKLGGNDPMCALRRDSSMTEEELDEYQIGQLYESQLVQLEKLIAVQRRSHLRAKNLLVAAEKRHFKALRELELEKERKSRYAAQGDDVLALLEKEREKLTQQLEIQINEVAESKAETERIERKLEAEKERHKTMVLFLINERKQMLVKMHELRVKSESYASNMSPGDQALLEELKKEVAFLRQERDSLKSANKSLKAENLSLKEVVKGQEADLLILRKNLISSTKLTFDKPGTHLPQLADERSLVVANRMATSVGSSNSGSDVGPVMSAGTLSSRTRMPSSPTKKTPAMGLGTTRRPQPPRYTEPELQELEAAIESMTASNAAPTSPTKRSNSLPRGGGGEAKKIDPPPVYRTEPAPRIPPQPQMGAASRLVPPARPDNTYRKPATATKRNGFSALTKAFGK